MTSTRDVEEEKSKRSRTRSGCFTCRDRHMKCDEQLPVCQNCINSKRKCLRGIRLNFTQYTLYDPKASLEDASYAPLGPITYRILDQSIPVASLYKDGLQAYEPCRYLHSFQDLQDAHQSLSQDLRLNSSSSSLYMDNTTATKPMDEANFADLGSENFIANTSMGLPVDPWSFSQPLPDGASLVTEDMVMENFDIRNLLMNPLTSNNQLQEYNDLSAHLDMQTRFEFPDRTPPKRHRTRTVTENIIGPEDSDKLVLLLYSEKYFWLLDLFNELDIWKSSIPKYAARLAQTKDHKDGKSRSKSHSYLLLECLLCCCHGSSMVAIDAACRKQLDLWSKFNTKDVTTSLFKDFERVLISNVLIVQALLLKAMTPDFHVTNEFENILATQGRLLHKLAARFQRISESKRRKLNGYVFTVASFQAMVILRFFLQMRLRRLNFPGTTPIADQTHQIFKPLSLGLDASMLSEPKCSPCEFFTVSQLELSHLKRGFQNFDLSAEKLPSDSAKLRARFWDLCVLNYHNQTQGACETPPLANYSARDVNASASLSPNDKCIALNIVSTYAKSIQDPESKLSVEPIFTKIQESLMTADEKVNWLEYFAWARDAP